MKIITAFKKVVPWFLVVVVVYVYGMSLTSHIWPPDHPWSGICLLLLAGNLFAESYDFKISPLVKSILRVLVILTALLWLGATLNK